MNVSLIYLIMKTSTLHDLSLIQITLGRIVVTYRLFGTLIQN